MGVRRHIAAPDCACVCIYTNISDAHGSVWDGQKSSLSGDEVGMLGRRACCVIQCLKF